MNLQRRPLGQTGLQVAPIGFGAFKIGRNTKTKYPQEYDLPTDGEIETLLNGVVDLGINFIDTAPAYGTSEEKVGKFLSHRRDEIVICTKTGEQFRDGVSLYDFSAEATQHSIEQSLQRLRTDLLDIVLIHSNGDDLLIQDQTDVVETLMKYKESGTIRAIGFSGKHPEGVQRAMKWADVVMVEYHLQDQTHRAVMKEVSDAGLGIIVKKGLAAGHLPPSEAISFVMSNQSVDLMVIGGLNLDHFTQNCAILHDDRSEISA